MQISILILYCLFFSQISFAEVPKINQLANLKKYFPLNWTEVSKNKEGQYFFQLKNCERPHSFEFKENREGKLLLELPVGSHDLDIYDVGEVIEMPNGFKVVTTRNKEDTTFVIEWHDKPSGVIKFMHKLYMDDSSWKKIKIIEDPKSGKDEAC